MKIWFFLLVASVVYTQEIPELDLEEAIRNDDLETAGNFEFLQATRDPIINAAAFQFSQVFFRLRGLDNRYGIVLLNGFKMNKMNDGRPQWNNWGGLNDITRGQQIHLGPGDHELHFGGLRGLHTIDLDVNRLRPGTRITISSSNRTYRNRLMTSFVSDENRHFSYALSASRRWGNQGYIDGTLYHAISFFGSLSLAVGPRSRLSFSAIYADNRRGRSAPLTDEVGRLLGQKYNPYWGLQDGKIRNARERRIREPLVMVNFDHHSESWGISAGYRFQWGKHSRMRLGYFNAPNPDPFYYRYLPSWYENSPIGTDFGNAARAEEGLIQNPQLDWERIYKANADINNPASYLLLADVIADTENEIFTSFNKKLGTHFQMDLRAGIRLLQSENYAEITDLLGAGFHEDIDPFTSTRNNLDGDPKKLSGDKINYNYRISASDGEIWIQGRYQKGKWAGFLAGLINQRSYRRTGLFKNERFLVTSEGSGTRLNFPGYAVKAGMAYNYSPRLVFGGNVLLSKIPPTIREAYLNAREQSLVNTFSEREKIWGSSLELKLRLPEVQGRLTFYYNRIMDGSDVNFYFTETGLGSDFVQEQVTGLDLWMKGFESYFSWNPSSTVRLTAVALVGRHVYASDPRVRLYVDNFGDLASVAVEGFVPAGNAKIKGLKIPEGPQQAYSLGLTYNDPKYWWAGINLNYLKDNYPGLAFIQYTNLFWINPDSGKNTTSLEKEQAQPLLRQTAFTPTYLLNLTGGKSWKFGDAYLGLFVSVNNLFNTEFRTGGYVQGRAGNYARLMEDQLGKRPHFGRKSWFGFGRTYFLNLTYSF